MIGDVTSGTMTLFQMPGRLSWSAPAPTIVAPSSPPISAWLLELGRPSHQVMRFQMIAPISAAATIACVVLASLTRPAPMVLATAVPANAPMKLNAAAMRMAYCGPQGLRGDRGRDRVRGVVEAVDVVEEDGQRDDDEQRQRDVFDGSTPRATDRAADAEDSAERR